ncbi:MAG TPA: hypothetical protein VM032_15730 [Vicinamibacterales bacterium]|nr:hypothetical protein [Vicinamibacterales bacterium]
MTPPIVFAYLDPGTGSYLLQLALAGALGASYAVKHFWARIKGLFTRSGAAAPDNVRG